MRTQLKPVILLLIVFILSSTVVFAAPEATVTLDLPSNVNLGESFEFTVTFDNTSPTDIGYGPFIDLWVPTRGRDGNDGITFSSAEYLNNPIDAQVFTFPAGGCIDHPYLRSQTMQTVQVCGTENDTFVVLELPFGSFAPTQPSLEITVTAVTSPEADLGAPLSIRARGGFRFGISPVDDPCCDPSVIGAEQSGTVTPSLMELTKDNDAPEYEVAAGPNGVHTWTITADVADGQTFSNLQLVDNLPAGITVSNINSTPTADNITITGGQLIASYASVSQDITLTFDFAVTDPTFLDSNTGNFELAENTVTVLGSWQPGNSFDQPINGGTIAQGGCPVKCPGGAAPFIMSLAIQKDAQESGILAPGNELLYNLDFQISDYFAFSGVRIEDILSDGQRYIPGSATLNLTLQGSVQPAQPLTPVIEEYFTGGTPGVGSLPAGINPGDTRLIFDIPGNFIGGCIPPAGGAVDCTATPGGTYGTITFRAAIQENFTDLHNTGGNSGDSSVDQGDQLENRANIAGELLNPATLQPVGNVIQTNDTKKEKTLPRGVPSKSVYAINENRCDLTVCPTTIAPGDSVTYRLQYTLPNADYENLRLVDYLPLPVFRANQLTQLSTIESHTPPLPGSIHFHPNDTLFSIIPTTPQLITDAASNSVTFDVGDFDSTGSQPAVVDILFTVTTTNRPFADGLRLTNMLRVLEGSTNAGEDFDDTITQIELTAPLLVMRKGAVASTGSAATYNPVIPSPVSFNPPGSATPFNGTINSNGLQNTPIDSDISGIEQGDLVTFAIVIENTGNSRKGAFDIVVKDNITPGFAIPDSGLNLQVRLGNGLAVTYTGSEQDFFGNGIELIDPNIDTGVCGPYNATSGTNIVVITYDLQLTAKPSEVLTNTASLTNYAGLDNGQDYTRQQDKTDTANVYVTGGNNGGGNDGGTTGNGNGYLSKTVDKPFAQPGDSLVWTVRVTNPTAVAVTSIKMVDVIPAGLTVTNTTTTRGIVTANQHEYSLILDSLNPGETVTLTFNTRINQNIIVPFQLVNTAVLSANGSEVGRASAEVISIATLPATGESPLSAIRPVIIGSLLLLLTAGSVLFRTYYR